VRRFAWALSALILMIALAGCQSTANGLTPTVTPDPSPQIFRIGNDTYTRADFTRYLQGDQRLITWIDTMLQQGQTPEQIEQLAIDQKIRSSILDSIVQDTLLKQYAHRNGVGVNPALIDATVLGSATPFDPTRPFSDTTTLRIAQAQDEVMIEVLLKNIRADMFHARSILVDSEATADQVLADLKAGKDFASLAKQYATGHTDTNGGDLGWVAKGDLSTEIDAAGFSLPLKTPSKVQSGNSWYVVEVLERQAGPTVAEKRPFDSFEQLQQSKNAQQFFEETFVPWYDQLRKDAEASGDLVFAPGFDPNSEPLPFPKQ
jgi:peptidyl-prolyl cis-trans isomerase C